MSLVEVLIAIAVFSIGVVALLSSIVSVFFLLESSKNQALALSDVRSIMERIRATPYSNMLTDFPDATVNGPSGSKRYSTVLGGYGLGTENMTVTYTNSATDPLEVKVTARWRDRFGRSETLALSTYKTR